MQLRGFSGKTYGLDKEFRRGGEGIVYAVSGASHLLAKNYFENKRTPERRAKIEAMVAAEVHKKAPNIAFPIDGLLDNSGNFVGFVMNRLDKALEVHQLYDRVDRAQLFPDAGVMHLVRTASNLARVFESLHDFGCVIGDVNERNILVRNDCTVSLIDSDSMQFTHGQTTHHCPVASPLYLPPELIGVSSQRVGKRNPNQDCFGLAVFIFRLLMISAYPFSGQWTKSGPAPGQQERIQRHLYAYSSEGSKLGVTPQHDNMDIGWLSRDIRIAFETAFGPSGRTARPTASQWVTLLDRFESSLIGCQNCSFHDYDPSISQTCPWCAYEHVTGRSAFGERVLKERSPPPPPPPPPPPSASTSTVTKKSSGGDVSPWAWAVGGIACLAVLGLITRNSDNPPTTPAPSQVAIYDTPVQTQPDVMTYQTSFDCERARNWVERQICTNQELANRDVQVSQIYNSLLDRLTYSSRNTLRETQRGFLGDRNACQTIDCIKQSYDNRLIFLTNYESPQPIAQSQVAVSRSTPRPTGGSTPNRYNSVRSEQPASPGTVLCTIPGRRGAPPQDLYLTADDCAARAGLIN